ncbi:DNA ligase D [Luteimonas aquatica]|uniref:DNA ligase D n=1 Tax=Luteimonas aquatica TaxID=450364 RepID=UPI001F55C51F|nr:DNA ligase D [Luteimonas aquatica]
MATLTDYQRKRRFDQTREPEPGKRLPKGRRSIFVVQLHHASRRHYDFRLQVGDALKSWAVPKGPSYDPKVKRMAVEVEDHPLDYAEFEGEIPHGHYGGGHVARFDTGYWSTEGDPEEQLAKGHLRFELFGAKLKGAWHLVRSGKSARQPQWLLIKDQDAFAGTLEADDLLADVAPPPAADAKRAGKGKPGKKRLREVAQPRRRKRPWAEIAAKLPGATKAGRQAGFFEPQLAQLVEAPPDGAQWLHEIKWDGYRLVARIVDGKAELWSRNALAWTAKVPEIAAALETLGLRSAALDGELIAGGGNKDDFNLLQATLSGDKQGVLSYVLFDLLQVDGIDIRKAPLSVRKALLARILDPAPAHLSFSSHVPGSGAHAYGLAIDGGFEGILSKRADRPHVSGRSGEWRKTKSLASDEFAIVGYTAPKGRRTGFGSLLLARPDAEHGWRYAGRVGTGFSEAMIDDISATLGASAKRPTVYVPPNDTDLRSARWFAPAAVVEVFYRGTGSQGLLRQPSLKALRPDKTPRDLLDSDRAPRPIARKKTVKTAKTAPRLTSPDKLLYPEDGITKRQVADYYAAMAPWMLPEIEGRPLSIVRCTQGIDRQCFFQKHHVAGLHAVDTVRLKEESGHRADYLVVRDADALMELVQFNSIEFHPWGALAKTPDRADRIVFDLDPGPEVAWREVVSAARLLHRILERDLRLRSFVRTSGGKGLHVVVPLNPGCPWSLVKPFARAIAEMLSESRPLDFVSTATKKFRKGRIFVDYPRNGRGATSVASFSLRARPGAPVAMPLRWSELSKVAGGHQFTLENAPRRVKRWRSHPWAGIGKVRQDLDQVRRLLKLRASTEG